MTILKNDKRRPSRSPFFVVCCADGCEAYSAVSAIKSQTVPRAALMRSCGESLNCSPRTPALTYMYSYNIIELWK